MGTIQDLEESHIGPHGNLGSSALKTHLYADSLRKVAIIENVISATEASHINSLVVQSVIQNITNKEYSQDLRADLAWFPPWTNERIRTVLSTHELQFVSKTLTCAKYTVNTGINVPADSRHPKFLLCLTRDPTVDIPKLEINRCIRLKVSLGTAIICYPGTSIILEITEPSEFLETNLVPS